MRIYCYRYPSISWGTAHSDFGPNQYGKDRERANWTDEEIAYIGEYVRDHPGQENMAARSYIIDIYISLYKCNLLLLLGVWNILLEILKPILFSTKFIR